MKIFGLLLEEILRPMFEKTYLNILFIFSLLFGYCWMIQDMFKIKKTKTK